MSVRRIVIGEREQRQAAPGGPVVEVVIGGEDGWPVGLVQVTVPAGGGMPAHQHGASATLLIPLFGTLRLVAEEGGEATELQDGVVATIPVGERVRLENTGDGEARLLAVLAPPDFASVVAGWPERQTADVLDARTLPPARRHPAIFGRLDELAVGAALTLVNDHDPRPLWYQLDATRHDDFSWDYEERGPANWRVRIGRLR